ncbi:hypothetical protein [Rahnella sp. ChDrAdgB13]|uniref:hypothetical protein n=1 Tax=Rahnella sp. ChDrAdgB13 TaxID=1850581 RepID=UPI001AD89147|nr:hypothetical protein [Rahnella sp. ChDrAdgB13]
MLIAPWILILTLSTSDGEAIDHIGFTTQEACRDAGRKWTSVHDTGSIGSFTDAICVPTDSPEAK